MFKPFANVPIEWVNRSRTICLNMAESFTKNSPNLIESFTDNELLHLIRLIRSSTISININESITNDLIKWNNCQIPIIHLVKGDNLLHAWQFVRSWMIHSPKLTSIFIQNDHFVFDSRTIDWIWTNHSQMICSKKTNDRLVHEWFNQRK